MKIMINTLPGYENIRPNWWVDSEDGCLHSRRGVVKGSWSRSPKYPYKHVTLITVDGHKTHKSLCRIIALALVDGRTETRNQVDHINGIHDDDRPENLRWVTDQENKDFCTLRRLKGKERDA